MLGEQEGMLTRHNCPSTMLIALLRASRESSIEVGNPLEVVAIRDNRKIDLNIRR